MITNWRLVSLYIQIPYSHYVTVISIYCTGILILTAYIVGSRLYELYATKKFLGPAAQKCYPGASSKKKTKIQSSYLLYGCVIFSFNLVFETLKYVSLDKQVLIGQGLISDSKYGESIRQRWRPVFTKRTGSISADVSNIKRKWLKLSFIKYNLVIIQLDVAVFWLNHSGALWTANCSLNFCLKKKKRKKREVHPYEEI